jgi:purine-nucleoside phosphorylase
VDTADTYCRVEAAADAIRRRCSVVPHAAIILGSGLSDFAARLADAATLAYEELPYWPPANVEGHPGRLVIGTAAGKRVAALAGRVHAYEGDDLGAVVFGTRVMGRLGVRRLILTNAAGAVNTTLTAGALMIIDDHINLMGNNPLVGENDERFGPRFPDMTEVYSRRLRGIADAAAASGGIAVTHGVYAALRGPSYETPAEVRYLRMIGADAVGMSTVPEAIAARHLGLEVLGISCISNIAADVHSQRLDHEQVLATMHRVQGVFSALLAGVLERL